ncbi:MAG: hypothetical protein KBS64_08240 [Treponema sp.]|nr:hypothetical protein [Candidatus Treponema equi]
MKRILTSVMTMFLSALCFCATVRDAEQKITAIETYKQMVAEYHGQNPFTAEEITTLNEMYESLESEEYVVSSKLGNLEFTVGQYDIEKSMWPVQIKGNYFDGKIAIDQEIELLYSDMMERQYVPEKEMVEYQRRDYEYYVTDYENRFRAGEELIYIELHFVIQKWLKASQYRFKPTELVFYKISKTDRVILSNKKLTAEFFSYEPAIEYRNKKELNADNQKVKRILVTESRQATATPTATVKEETSSSGRRAVYFSLETFVDNKNSKITDISTLQLDSFDAALTFGIGNVFFAGLELCFDVANQDRNSVYSFGGLAGASIEIAKIFRPFICAGAAVRTDDRSVLKAGIGSDIKISHILLTSTYCYNWNHAFDSNKEAFITDREDRSYHSLTVGIGLTW